MTTNPRGLKLPWTDRLESCPTWKLLVLLLLICVSIYFVPLVGPDFYNKGEPREALVVRDIVENGNWLLPMRNGQLPSKPPMFHWIAASISTLGGGVSTFAIRSPSALFGVGTVILTFLFGRMLRGQTVGFIAAVILATSFRYAKLATQARVDMTTSFFVTSSIMLCYCLLVSEKQRKEPLFLSLYILVAFSVLSKGPLGAIVPALTVGVYSLLRRDFTPVQKLFRWRGVFIFLALVGGWYGFALTEWGDSFSNKQIVGENISALLGKEGAGHRHAIYYYIPQLFTGVLLWGGVLPFMLVWWAREGKTFWADWDLYTLSWFLAVFGFFTVGSQKRADYLLLVFPVVALWLGHYFVANIRASNRSRLTRPLLVVGLVSLVLAVLVLAGISNGSIALSTAGMALSQKDHAVAVQVEQFLFSNPILASLLIGFTLIPWILSFVWLVMKNHAAAFCSLLASNLLFLSALLPVGNRIISRERSFRPFAEQIKQLVRTKDQLVLHNATDFGLIFYLQRIVPSFDGNLATLSRKQESFVILPVAEWENSAPEVKARFVEIVRSQATGSEGNRPVVLVKTRAPLMPTLPCPFASR